MPADPSIYSLIRPQERQPGPLDNFGSMLQLRALIDSGALNDLHRQKLQGDLDEETAFKGALSKLTDFSKPLGADVYATSPTRAAAFEKTRLDTEKARGEIDYKKVQTQAEQAKVLRDGLAAVTDQPGYDAWRQTAADMKARIALEAPQVFDPKWQQQHVMTADKFIEQRAPKHEWRSDGQTERLFQTNPNAGKVGPVEGAPAITKQMTPGEADAARRAAESLTETKRHNLVTEAQGAQSAGKLTDTQGAATAFGLRAQTSNDILVGLENSGTFNKGVIKQAAEGLPFVGGAAGSVVNTLPTALGGPNANQQKYEQAQRDFINAVLRKESGAVISEEEFANARKQYFPQPGDAKETIDQKRKNRDTSIQALSIQAGPGAAKIPPAAEPRQPIARKSPKEAALGGGKGGIKFLGFE